MTDEELIVAVINDPDGKYGRLYDHMMLNALEVTKATINDEAVDDIQTVEINDVDIVEE